MTNYIQEDNSKLRDEQKHGRDEEEKEDNSENKTLDGADNKTATTEGTVLGLTGSGNSPICNYLREKEGASKLTREIKTLHQLISMTTSTGEIDIQQIIQLLDEEIIKGKAILLH